MDVGVDRTAMKHRVPAMVAAILCIQLQESTCQVFQPRRPVSGRFSQRPTSVPRKSLSGSKQFSKTAGPSRPLGRGRLNFFQPSASAPFGWHWRHPRGASRPRIKEESKVNKEQSSVTPVVSGVDAVLPATLPNIDSGSATAKKAAQFLTETNLGYVIPTARQKRNLVVACAKRDLIVYGKAFDVVRLTGEVDLDSLEDVEIKLGQILFCEIKSTKQRFPEDFCG